MMHSATLYGIFQALQVGDLLEDCNWDCYYVCHYKLWKADWEGYREKKSLWSIQGCKA